MGVCYFLIENIGWEDIKALEQELTAYSIHLLNR